MAPHPSAAVKVIFTCVVICFSLLQFSAQFSSVFWDSALDAERNLDDGRYTSTTETSQSTDCLGSNNTTEEEEEPLTRLERELLSVTERYPKRFRPDNTKDRCALLFFGLPRSFREIVLPSIRRNLLIPNAGCDVFVHYHRLYHESKGRLNDGGHIPADDISLLLRDVWDVHRIAQSLVNVTLREPVVAFDHDTTESFRYKRRTFLNQVFNHSLPNSDVRPYMAEQFSPESTENIVKQWHSVESVWNFMEAAAARAHVQYTRVGMFRSDVMFLTPMDIYLVDPSQNLTDAANKVAIIPRFGPWFNDRIFYGPYDAVKLWATERFSRADEYVHRPETIQKSK